MGRKLIKAQVPQNKHETEDLDGKVIVKTVTVIEDKIHLNP